MPEERKLVTILFADVTGWTALGEALDPEDVRALVSRCYRHARRIVEEHGGTLEKFIGDATMAVFGLPHVHGNDAERALATALALRAAVADDPFLAPHFEVHTGVSTGEVATAHAAPDPATADSLVTGDVVNTAARLYDAAETGEILAGERTRTAAESAFLFGERWLIAAKNKRHPLTAYPLLGPRPARRMPRPPLVGRKRELAQLGLLRDAGLDEHHPQLISIVAPAGTGKTRLLEEFLSGLDPEEGWQVATARCLPYGQSLTYWPLRGLLEKLLGASFSRELIRATFVAGGQEDADAGRLTDLLLASLGVETGEAHNGGCYNGEDAGADERRAIARPRSAPSAPPPAPSPAASSTGTLSSVRSATWMITWPGSVRGRNNTEKRIDSSCATTASATPALIPLAKCLDSAPARKEAIATQSNTFGRAREFSTWIVRVRLAGMRRTTSWVSSVPMSAATTPKAAPKTPPHSQIGPTDPLVG